MSGQLFKFLELFLSVDSLHFRVGDLVSEILRFQLFQIDGVFKPLNMLFLSFHLVLNHLLLLSSNENLVLVVFGTRDQHAELFLDPVYLIRKGLDFTLFLASFPLMRLFHFLHLLFPSFLLFQCSCEEDIGGLDLFQ